MSRLPAILGGEPAFPKGTPALVPDEAIRLALQNAWEDHSWAAYDAGKTALLEEQLKQRFGVSQALTCASGTLAVEVALKSLGIQPGDLVAMAAYDYPGNFLTIHALGAMPFLVDLDPGTCQISLEGVAAALRAGVKAVVASHLHGGLIPMKELLSLCGEKGVGVVEDACQCPGAMVQGKPAGSWGDCGVISFGGSKLLTSGRGGALLTSNPALAQRARVQLTRGSKVAALSEIQAAVLLPQLLSLEDKNQTRSAGAALLHSQLKSLPGFSFFSPLPDQSSPAYYKLGILFDASAFGLSREQFLLAAKAEGIPVDAGFAALQVGRSPRRWQSAGPLPMAAKAHEQMLVLHHGILAQEESLLKMVPVVKQIQAQSSKICQEIQRRLFTPRDDGPLQP